MTFVLKQRAFLKMYIISKAEKGGLYGFRMMEEMHEHFKNVGYKPSKSEVYKSLHELLDEGILDRRWRGREENKLQEIAIYNIKDMDKAKAYKKLLKADIDRSIAILQQGIKDNF